MINRDELDISTIDSAAGDNATSGVSISTVLPSVPEQLTEASSNGSNGSSSAKTVQAVENIIPDRPDIPDIVISRLPVYLRTLRLLGSEGQEVTSSQELGERLGISSAQLRKDLSHFGEFGKQGTGYNIVYLCRQLEKILKVDDVWPVILVGAGYLGHALASYNGFEDRGFRIVAAFDSDVSKVNSQLGQVPVLHISTLKQYVAQHQCQIGIMAVPAPSAQLVADTLVEAGISSILSYAPINLNVPKNVRIEYIDPVIHFQHMTYYLEKPS
ncbi:MAG: redox-sensing transcriptional repressor Rex [Chloroflexota bacterium]